MISWSFLRPAASDVYCLGMISKGHLPQGVGDCSAEERDSSAHCALQDCVSSSMAITTSFGIYKSKITRRQDACRPAPYPAGRPCMPRPACLAPLLPSVLLGITKAVAQSDMTFKPQVSVFWGHLHLLHHGGLTLLGLLIAVQRRRCRLRLRRLRWRRLQLKFDLHAPAAWKQRAAQSRLCRGARHWMKKAKKGRIRMPELAQEPVHTATCTACRLPNL